MPLPSDLAKTKNVEHFRLISEKTLSTVFREQIGRDDRLEKLVDKKLLVSTCNLQKHLAVGHICTLIPRSVKLALSQKNISKYTSAYLAL